MIYSSSISLLFFILLISFFFCALEHSQVNHRPTLITDSWSFSFVSSFFQLNPPSCFQATLQHGSRLRQLVTSRCVARWHRHWIKTRATIAPFRYSWVSLSQLSHVTSSNSWRRSNLWKRRRRGKREIVQASVKQLASWSSLPSKHLGTRKAVFWVLLTHQLYFESLLFLTPPPDRLKKEKPKHFLVLQLQLASVFYAKYQFVKEGEA